MPDMTAIAQAFGALKAMKDIGEAMIGLRDAAAFRERQIEFQQRIIDAQSAISLMQDEHTALITKVRALEEELIRLKEWNVEKQNYKLVEVGPGAFAYVVKPEAQGAGPEHLICPTCYENSKNSVLQAMPLIAQRAPADGVRSCPVCKTQVAVARNAKWKPPNDRRW